MFDGEERQQAAVTVLFVLVIAAVVLILLGAVALAYYNDNLRPLARVGQVEIGTPLLRDRIELEQWRINREGNRLTEASLNLEIDAETMAARVADLEQRSEGLATNGLEDLIDDIYQSQLAVTEGITVTEAEVEARVAAEVRRRRATPRPGHSGRTCRVRGRGCGTDHLRAPRRPRTSRLSAGGARVRP